MPEDRYGNDRSQVDTGRASVEATIGKVNDEIVSLRSEVRATDGRLGEVQKELEGKSEEVKQEFDAKTKSTGEELNAKIIKLEEQSRSDRLQSIQILALFVAFFTFVSVQFQLFAVVKETFTVIALSMVLLGALLLFVCLAHLGVDYFRDGAPKFGGWLKGLMSRGLFWLFAASLLILSIGLIFAFMAKQESQLRKVEQQNMCRALGDKVEGAITKQLSTGEFLKERYQHECTDAWMSE
jgi:hypothetical protein